MDAALFKTRVYVVTGGAAGIGLAVAKQLLEYGAYVYVLDIQDSGVSALENDRVTYIRVDVRSRKDCREALASVMAKHRKIDGLVNNAAICPSEGESPAEELYDQVFDINVRGYWNMGMEALIHMRKQTHGSIVNVGSTSSLVGKNRLPLYTGSKHAILGFTRSWALDFAKYGIRVNCVGPGATDTAMARAPLQAVMGPRFGENKTDDELLECVATSIPLGKIGSPSDVANAVNFLLSDLAGYVTGQIICVAGGS
ncbi:hypothetical protein MBLNU459_g7079t1 [Dothideomycetes sp. NU459]